MSENNLIQIRKLVDEIDSLLDTNDGHALSTQASKLAIHLERILEGKADAKRRKNVSYANEYHLARETNNVSDAKIIADSKKSTEFEHIESLESGIKAILSTIKSKLDWLKLESQSGRFE